MLFIIGIIVVFGSVGWGFVLSHGQLAALWQPFEVLIIVGAALGAYLISNPFHLIIDTFKLIPQVILGSKVNKAMCMDVLSLIYDILNKSRREGMMAIESDVENPNASAIFARYPAILMNEPLARFIADYFRIISSGNLASHELEALMEQEIDARLHEIEAPANALSKVADALPGFGIVAAVLGIVITMASIGGDPAVIGQHVAAALVGTFMGILFAYGLVGPVSTRMKHIAEDEIKLYEAAKASIIASMNGLAPQLAIEFGRKSLFTHGRPTFDEVDSKVRGR
jgi:chemotaxis protein MotA|tara:strand:- start:5636 stop:6487 length:852 start_codon:yes stop_codon:yes gene_type:complete